MPLLEVQVLEVVSEQVEVGGGRVEVVVDGDPEAVDVGAAVGAGDVPLGGGDLPQGLGDAELILSLATQTPAAAADRPHDGEDDQEGEEDALDDDQLPGGVDVGPGQLLALPAQPVPVQHLPERVQVQAGSGGQGLPGGCEDVHVDGGCCLV